MGGLNGGRILKFDSTGALAATFGEVTDPELAGQEYCDIAVDEINQNIYIVTRYNHMVAKFDMDGAYLGAWQGDLSNPNSIAIGAQGQVFVADTYNNQVDQYDADGNLTYTMSSSQLYRPSRIVVDDSGKLYIAVESYQTVQVYQ
jgi:tripartite motif-containing protein 71